MIVDDDELVFAPEVAAELADADQGWRILIVDDDMDVHSATQLALKNTRILDRPLEFLHTYSAAETRELLTREKDIAVILLDVVMESEDAGLQLVRTIREDLKLSELRIVLRTGQPGYAPEIQAIRNYDINDYKTKSELTHTRLYTTLTVAIRSYEQIRAINASRRGLELIVRASGELMEQRGLKNFAAGVITQLAALLDLPPEGLICARETDQGETGMQVIAAGGKYSELINHTLAEIPAGDVRDAIDQALLEGESCFQPHSTTLLLDGHGRRIAVYLETRHKIDSFDRHLLEVFCANITIGFENTALYSKLHNLAYFDPLTGLPNRLRFLHELDERVISGHKGDSTAALIDIDGFAETNDALGHQFGDRLLKAVANRLTSKLPDCTIARIAGDTFGVLGDQDKVTPVSLSLLFHEPFHVDEHELVVSTTQGFLKLEEIEGSGGDALKSTSIALKRAKQSHRGEYSFFTREMDIEIRERVKLLHALRAAFDNERLFLMYQPQVELGSGRPVGVEALIRWRSDDGRFVPPDRFIPLAEHSGLIVGIGMWVLRMACFEQARLERAGFAIRVAINVSVAQFRHPEFIETVREALADSRATPALIELEITESMAMEDADFVTAQLHRLASLGITMAIDDFGTGFSSLAYLQKLPVNRLKIDKAFVHDICTDPRGRQIPGMVIQLGSKLGLTVIAEGIEDEDQAKALIELGCHEAQGFLYGRPMETRHLYTWLESKPSHR